MNKTQSVELDIGGRRLRIETGLLARQAAGAATVFLGETAVFSAVTCADKPREGVDFFPLQVEYREKFYAAGRMPGGYFKRESRPSEREILVARATDRPLRPLFPAGFRNDVQINNSLLCTDGENESDTLSVIASSAALTLSDIPFFGPIAAVRVGRIEGRFVLNPGHSEMAKSDLDLIYAGTRDRFLMMEGSASEISEADFLAALQFGQEAVRALCDAQLELRRKMGLPEKQVAETPPVAPDLLAQARALAGDALAKALAVPGKQERHERVDAAVADLKARLLAARPDLAETTFSQVADTLEADILRRMVLETGRRLGGRAPDEIRTLDAQVGLLPRTHGSALFSRGETQALAVVTLGTHQDAQSVDAIAGGPDEKTFLLHYNFPPFSVGEVGRLGAVGRREIGHGALAERSIKRSMPAEYPYTVRVVSEIMGSNGSSSMASVCAGTLALMDAGIPMAKPVAGISIGLFTGADKTVLVTDISGEEDHFGDMDFKIAGTRDGITGFQVDLKVRGLPWPVVEDALARAREARHKLLDFMGSVIPAPRAELSKYAPRITVLKIPVDKIGALIGPGGKNIRRVTDTYKVQIDVEDDGAVRIYSTDAEGMAGAVREVELLTAQAEVGKIYTGRVTGVKEFGCFVEILPGLEGMVHISELANFRVRAVEDVCKVGDPMTVKCLHVDDNGKIRLSRRAAMDEKDGAAGAPQGEGGAPGGGEPRPYDDRRRDRHGGPGGGGRRGPPRRHDGGDRRPGH
jgi:polyribonucleotide nucleotidyltransferase